jgi:hypothetical protein
MKKALILLVFMFVAGFLLMAQDKSTITVKNSQVSNGVVIITATLQPAAEKAKGTLELHCNKDASSCKAPAAGAYVMVRLPKNWGMYDCTNVDLYPDGADPASAEKIGEYCLIEK